jgi:hypothetical protein
LAGPDPNATDDPDNLGNIDSAHQHLMLETPTEPPPSSVAMPTLASVQSMESNVTSVPTQQLSSDDNYQGRMTRQRTGQMGTKPK